MEFPPRAAIAVVDPRLAAPRGDHFTNAAMAEEARRKQRELAGDLDFYDERERDREQADREDTTVAASLSTPIPASNVGYKLLQKMGWKGRGLGKNEDGITEPVRSGVDPALRLGLGKQEEDDEWTNPENINRKQLTVEVMATETEEQAKKREDLAEMLIARQQDVTEMIKTFLCETCSKQYTTAMELEAHLSSYDHHHKKRLAEMRAMTAERTKAERTKKEQRQMDKEMARLQKQAEIAQQAQRSSTQAQQAPAGPSVPPPPPPSASQPPLPPGVPPPLLQPVGVSGSGGGGWSQGGQQQGGWGPAATQKPVAPPPPPPGPASSGLPQSSWQRGGWGDAGSGSGQLLQQAAGGSWQQPGQYQPGQYQPGQYGGQAAPPQPPLPPTAVPPPAAPSSNGGPSESSAPTAPAVPAAAAPISFGLGAVGRGRGGPMAGGRRGGGLALGGSKGRGGALGSSSTRAGRGGQPGQPLAGFGADSDEEDQG